MIAAGKGHAGCVRILMSKEARMVTNDCRNTALMIAAYNGKLECVKILAPLEKGMKDNYGETAKFIASPSRRNHPDCYNYLSSFE